VSASAAAFARAYRKMGLTTIRLAPGLKHPNYSGWKAQVSQPEHWAAHPRDGIAIRLEPSGLVSLDVDDEERAEGVLRHLGADLGKFRANAPCVVGRHFKLFYRAPEIALKHRSITWPKRDAPGNFVLFELRAGNLSDTLPPTVHPGTGEPYRWENPPRNGFPPLPARLLELWLDWPETARKARALCPWAPPPRPLATRQAKPLAARQGPSVIAEFNAAHDVAAILEAHGYQKRGKRFAAPDSSHAAGLVLLDTGKLYCHHAGDPLSGEHALDCFDIYRILDHGGDYRAAVKAAAIALGLGAAA
jgi:putative DNA primase/helicase